MGIDNLQDAMEVQECIELLSRWKRTICISEKAGHYTRRVFRGKKDSHYRWWFKEDEDPVVIQRILGVHPSRPSGTRHHYIAVIPREHYNEIVVGSRPKQWDVLTYSLTDPGVRGGDGGTLKVSAVVKYLRSLPETEFLPPATAAAPAKRGAKSKAETPEAQTVPRPSADG